MTIRVVPKLITVTENCHRIKNRIAGGVVSRFWCPHDLQPPAQPSPAQHSLADTVQQVWESAGGFYAFIQYFYVCCLLYSDPESK